MKPTNTLPTTREFWVLRDYRGEFYAYSTPDGGVRCTDRIDMARKYSTRKGASVATFTLSQAYGKQMTPILYRTTYEPA